MSEHAQSDTPHGPAAPHRLRPVEGPQVWTGAEMATRPGLWTHTLTAAEWADAEQALHAVQARGLDLLDVGAGDFPLPVLEPRLAAIRRETLHGRGFFLLRGVPVERLSQREAALVFWGLGTHLGIAVPQNAKGHVLGHVRDLGLDYAKPEVRGYQTRAGLAYHTDYADLVCLLSLRTARAGGASSIVSSVRLYNELVRTRPELAAALCEPYPRTRWGEIPAGKAPWTAPPVFNPYGDTVYTTYVGSAIRKAQEMTGVPPLSALQIQAMETLDALAAREDLHLDMHFAPGDIQVLNNHWVLHARTSYEDHDRPEDKRHLLRLWLACEDGPPLPAAITSTFQGSTAQGRPNGIQVPGVPPSAPLDAE